MEEIEEALAEATDALSSKLLAISPFARYERTVPLTHVASQILLVSLLEEERRLARFAAALDRPDFAYMTTSHPVTGGRFTVYRRDATSPTGVLAVCSVEPTPEARAIAARRNTHAREGGKALGSRP